MTLARVIPLYHGTLETDRAWITFGPPFKPPVIATRSAPVPRNPLCQIPVQTFVIEHPDGLVLFDCGIRADWANTWPQAYQEIAWYDHTAPRLYFERVLDAAGYGPEDFRYVFVSHLHADHAGGLSLFQHVDVPVLVHEDELRGALRLDGDQEFYVRGDYDLPGVNWTSFYGDRELLAGIEVIEVPGHTWGTMALCVETASGSLILASDACLNLEAYGPPGVSSLSNMDHERYLASVEKIRRRAASIGARVIFGHDCNCAVHAQVAVSSEPLRYWPGNHY